MVFPGKLNKHDVKFGFDFHRTTVVQEAYDAISGASWNSPWRIFLPAPSMRIPVLCNTDRHTYENNFGFYARMGSALTPHLTLNYGFRWDYMGVIGEKKHLLSNITNLDLATKLLLSHRWVSPA